MRVYDRRASGFIPGEGCGFVVLKRLEDARAAGDTVYAVVRGWGVSSDGKGGLTAPSLAGQARPCGAPTAGRLRALGQLDFIEGHGTGTRVGDKRRAGGRRRASLRETNRGGARSCGMTSFKSISATPRRPPASAPSSRRCSPSTAASCPPTAGCAQPNDVFDRHRPKAVPDPQGEVATRSDTPGRRVGDGVRRHQRPRHPGVGRRPRRRFAPGVDERALLAADQDTEVFVLGADPSDELRGKLRAWRTPLGA